MRGLPPIERFTLPDLKQQTAEADEYVNSATSKREAKRRSQEVTTGLNKAIEPHYLHQPVSVFGLHKKVARAKRGDVHVYLKDGVMEGFAEGFVVLDFDEDFNDIEGDKYPRQRELLERMRLFAPGRYAVSHLVRLGVMQGRTKDFLLEQSLVFRGVSPVYASEIFIEEDMEIPPDSETLETERIISLSEGTQKNIADYIQHTLETADDPLPALVQHARKFRGVPRPDQYGLKRVIAEAVADKMFGYKYHFGDGIPLFFRRNPDGTGSGPASDEQPQTIYIAGLDKGPHYMKSSGQLSDEQALYLVGYLMNQEAIEDSLVVIPLEELHDRDIRRLDDD